MDFGDHFGYKYNEAVS